MKCLGLLLIGFLVFFTSCKEINASKASILKIDFKKIDAYPLLPECNNLTNRELQKNCFYTNISKRIQIDLENYSLKNKIFKDTIFVKIFIDNKGKSYLKNRKKTNLSLDSLLQKSIDNLPIMSPAIKKGIPINVEFILPVVLY
jgi:hypothetical protein